jgi:hypothetical protein
LTSSSSVWGLLIFIFISIAAITIAVSDLQEQNLFGIQRAYALGASEWEAIESIVDPKQRLEAIEAYQREMKEVQHNAAVALNEELQAEREQQIQAWPQKHQQLIRDETAEVQEAQAGLNKVYQRGSELIAEELANATVQATMQQDSQFNTFVSIWQNCMNAELSKTPTTTIATFGAECSTPFIDANSRWCGIEQYDQAKCSISSRMQLELITMRFYIGQWEQSLSDHESQLEEITSLSFEQAQRLGLTRG